MKQLLDDGPVREHAATGVSLLAYVWLTTLAWRYDFPGEGLVALGTILAIDVGRFHVWRRSERRAGRSRH